MTEPRKPGPQYHTTERSIIYEIEHTLTREEYMRERGRNDGEAPAEQ